LEKIGSFILINLKLKFLQRTKYADNIFVFAYAAIVIVFFLEIFRRNIPTDLQLHIRILETYLLNGHFPDTPLYYLAIYVIHFLFFSSSFINATIIILSVSCIIKYILVRRFLQTSNPNIADNSFFPFSLMFLSPLFIYYLDGNNWYLGKFTSSIWHNSTTIFVFPICIWLFMESLEYLKKPALKKMVKLLGISILILLAKPSFLFAFIIAFPLICFVKFGFLNKYFLFAGASVVLILLCLFLQKQLIYTSTNSLDKLIYGAKESHVIVAPFRVWLLWTNHPALSIFSSFAFVFSFIILKYKVYKSDIEVWYSIMLLVVSLFVFFLFAESGPRLYHGNFYWQIPVSMLIINMVFVKKILSGSSVNNFSGLSLWALFRCNKIICSLYLLQFISGLCYLSHILITKSYL